jgi:aspartate aminotransferase-like enzyme
MAGGTFFFPGPTEVRLEVLKAMVRQPLPHRAAEFREVFAAVQGGLREVFRTERPVYVATASGTAMMEAAIRCAPRGRILVLANGAFAERFVKIAHACGRDADRHEVALGDVPHPDEVRDLLGRGSYSAATLVHSETSTGALADIREITRVAHEAGVALIVDSVSGIGGAQVETDEWKPDCVFSASQKALALPPGLSFAVASESFLRGAAEVGGRGVYLDLLEFDAHARNDETPATPSASLFFALAHQLADIRREGMSARWARHEAMRLVMDGWVDSTRDALAMELGILAKPGVRSPTVTVVTLPPRISAFMLVDEVAARGYTIGTGYGLLRATTFRVGHMGDHSVADLMRCLDAIADSLGTLQRRASS